MTPRPSVYASEKLIQKCHSDTIVPLLPSLNTSHVWRIAATGTAAFMSRAYLKRATAAHAAERWGLSAFRFVQRCGLGASCPRKPPATAPGR